MNNHCGMDLSGRLACIEGHIKGIRQMVTDDKPCEEVLLQLSAVEAAVNKAGKLLLKEHLEHCVRDGIANGDLEIFDRFSSLLDKYIK